MKSEVSAKAKEEILINGLSLNRGVSMSELHEFESELPENWKNLGCLGRPKTDLSAYKPVAFNGTSRFVLYGDDGLPNGLMCEYFIREEGSKGYVLSFITQPTLAEQERILNAPIHAGDRPVRVETYREYLARQSAAQTAGDSGGNSHESSAPNQ